MDSHQLAAGLMQYLLLVALLTFHEFGHAWTAMKCGDDTAKSLGRVSLNPLVHIDLIGTVLLPLTFIFVLPMYAQFAIGWAKPVPVETRNLRNKNFDDLLVTLAGPAMNLILAFALVALARIGQVFHSPAMAQLCWDAARLSLLLCFFNLIPIPPLDGSRVLRVLTGMTWEAYMKFYQFTFYGLGVVIVWQIQPVRDAIIMLTFGSREFFAWIFGVH